MDGPDYSSFALNFLGGRTACNTLLKAFFYSVSGLFDKIDLDYYSLLRPLYISSHKCYKMINRIAVFCGSGFGSKKIFTDRAYELGRLLAQNHFGLVYGGSGTGLMGVVANGVIENKGEAIGVLPHFLKDREVAHPNLSQLILVADMHQRKAKMNELADAFVVLPGGLGTLEECFEILTWSQLGLHNKPVILLNLDGFYNPLLLLIENLNNHGFIKYHDIPFFYVFDNIKEAIARIKNTIEPTGSQSI